MSTSISVGPRARCAAAGLALAALAVGCATPPPPVRAGQSPGYAASAWATLHRDSRNSDFAPLFATPALRVAWAALEGAAMWVGPSLGPEGHVYATSGRGEGTSHLHAFDRDGNLLWESAPMRSLADLDYGAVINAPLVADDGDVYQADVDQLWAFDANGAVRWVASLRDAGAQGHFVTPIFSKEGHVGGITTDGKVLFFARADGALVWPAFDLPGVGGPPATPAPPGLLEGGLHAREFVQPMWNLIFGREIEVANTPSVHPETGRIFITAGGASPSEGALYGIDTTPEGPVVAFAHPMAQGSGTSPAISPDGALVYAAGDDGVMVAVDAATGALVWRAEDTAAAASPSVGGDGVVYSTTRGQGLVAIDGRTGARRFAVDFTPLAERVLAESPERGPRVASVNSILTVTD
ncbi:MAG: PQQ-binding-like beta-propeller repeat protein, partial [Myxococcales bacterium]|nr:PQQ-binding-like beta-propeller repeat protein [Myxococcales bacterium]